MQLYFCFIILQLTCCDVDTVSGPIGEDVSATMSQMQKEEVKNVEDIIYNVVECSDLYDVSFS